MIFKCPRCNKFSFHWLKEAHCKFCGCHDYIDYTGELCCEFETNKYFVCIYNDYTVIYIDRIVSDPALKKRIGRRISPSATNEEIEKYLMLL